MFTFSYDYHEPGFPPKGDSRPRTNFEPQPLEELLAKKHGTNAVLSPLSWPEGGAGFRVRKPWMLDDRSKHTPYRLVCLDYDREGHKPWPDLASAEAAASSVSSEVFRVFGAAFAYPSRRGVRALFLTPEPVPLFLADSWLRAALDKAPVISGLNEPDPLTWTTGQRPPWVASAHFLPWGEGEPPIYQTPEMEADWRPSNDLLVDERGKLRPKVLSAFDASALDGAERRALIAELDAQVADMAATVAASTARHPTLFACARRLGGWLERLGLPREAARAAEARYTGVLAAAAPDSKDAERTIADGIGAGRSAPAGLPSELVDFFGDGDEE